MKFGKIYSIIKDNRVEKTKKGVWIYILSKKIEYYTKEMLKYFKIILIAFCLIIAIILMKYKPIYKVSISGKELGYLGTKKTLEESIKNKMLETQKVNIDSIQINTNPEYEFKLVDRDTKTNEEEIIANMKDNIVITYKYYEIALSENSIQKVNTLEEAEELINLVKEENNTIDLTIDEKYTQNKEELGITNIEIAKQEISAKTKEAIKNQEAKKAEEERIKALPEVNGIKLAIKPVSGTITSRYGVSSKIRKSNHTGLDIATSAGTPIKVVANGTVTNAKYSGSYGNLVKISHGNGIETWYAHTSKMNVKVGQKVNAGDVIATVGSTGNSTGAHLHFEIRVNGKHVNPQNYLYK